MTWLLRGTAGVGTGGVTFIEAWSWATPVVDANWLAPLAFAGVVGMSYVLVIGLAGLVVAGIAAAARMFLTAGVAAAGTAIATGPLIAVWLTGSATVPPASGAAEIVVLSANVLYGRADIPTLVGDIERVSPDVVLIQEPTPGFERDLIEAIGGDYPHIVRASRPDATGQTTLSRLPFARPPAVRLVDAGSKTVADWPQIGVWVEVGAAEAELWNVHLIPPVGFRQMRAQDGMARGFAEKLDESTADAIVLAGDFNAPERSSPLRRLTSRGAESVHHGRGRVFEWTWPVSKALLLRTRIDQALAAGRGGTAAVWVDGGRGSPNGSDHRPVWGRLAITPR
ncbi:MAG: endonuclease/exonuclease/phosphatase family protein [Planctomycetota bacterium]